MFIDYVSLLLINTVAGLFILASFIHKGLMDAEQTKWAPGFIISSFIPIVIGGYMVLTWPLPGSYNIAFGEMSVLLGLLFLGTGLALSKGWSLLTVAMYGFFAGLAAFIIGLRFIHLGLSKEPLIAGLGFIFTGMGGMMAFPVFHWKEKKFLRLIGATVILIACVIWALTGYFSYWSHLDSFSKWSPSLMK